MGTNENRRNASEALGYSAFHTKTDAERGRVTTCAPENIIAVLRRAGVVAPYGTGGYFTFINHTTYMRGSTATPGASSRLTGKPQAHWRGGTIWECAGGEKQTALRAAGGRGRPPLQYRIFIIINHMGLLQRRGALRNAEDSVPYRTWFNHMELCRWWVSCRGLSRSWVPIVEHS